MSDKNRSYLRVMLQALKSIPQRLSAHRYSICLYITDDSQTRNTDRHVMHIFTHVNIFSFEQGNSAVFL